MTAPATVATTTALACKACLSGETEVFYEQYDVPTNSCILLETAEEAKGYPRGDIVLTFCHSCGFVFNQAFDPKLTEYSGRYEETQAFSETFNSFHYALADRLIDDHDLHGKRVLEIGCGKGEFLQLLCERANTSGIGFDPGYQEGRLELADDLDISFVKDFYGEKYTDQSADFVCCKMTLEHIPEAKHFMDIVRNTIADDVSDVFFQIPESERIFSGLAFEDVYYEHCNYFTPHSLAELFRRTDFVVEDIAVEYDDQYLTIEAVTGEGEDKVQLDDQAVERLWDHARTYSSRLREVIDRWRSEIDAVRDRNGKVVMWGSGSKGVSFLSAVERDDSIDAVVDINPNRHGHFMCGSGHPIVSPESLVDLKPDLVIVMNRIYVDEIRASLDEIGLKPEIPRTRRLMMTTRCLACRSATTLPLAELDRVPVVANDLHRTPEAARTAACGEMLIHYCSNCHHFFNSSFDESLIEYSANYETSLHFSEVFQKYAAGLVDMLVDDYGIRGKRILEVGCGRGEFLNSLCAAGDNHGIGFDTSYDGGDTIGDRHPNLVIHDTYFDQDLTLDPIDLVVSQQVLEHVLDPQAFLDQIVSHPAVAAGNALLYLEVPNGLYTFENDGIWDLIYEHVSYFSIDSLRRVVAHAGCSIIESGESYGGQYLYVVARVGGATTPLDDDATERGYGFVDGFGQRFSDKLDHWHAALAEPDTAARTFVWGAGSKGITFCNIVDPDARLGGLVDRHPNKRGKHIPVTGLGILGPDRLDPSAVDTVIVMNPLYVDEIRTDLATAGIAVDVVVA